MLGHDFVGGGGGGERESSSFMPSGGKATIVLLKIFIGAFGDVQDKTVMSAD